MIDLILKMLDLDEHYAVSKEIDIAKGLYQTPLTVKDGIKQIKRRNSWQ